MTIKHLAYDDSVHTPATGEYFRYLANGLVEPVSLGGGGGVTDHGDLTGLGDDDHTNYLNVARHDAHDHTTAMSTVSIEDIGDVLFTGLASGEVMVFDGTNWINDAIALAEHTHVEADITDLGVYPDATGLPLGVTPRSDGANGWTYVAIGASGESFNGSYTEIIGDGVNVTYTVTHQLETTAVLVQTYLISTGAIFDTTITVIDTDTIEVEFFTPPDLNSIRVVVLAAGGGSGSATTTDEIVVEAGYQGSVDDTTDPEAISLTWRWGVDNLNEPYFDSAGVTTGEEAILIFNKTTGQFYLETVTV